MNSEKNRSPSRVAFVLPALEAGGMEQVTLLTAQGLMHAGYSVDLVLEHQRGEYLSRVTNNIRIFGLTKGSKFAAYARLIWARPADGLVQLAKMLFSKTDYVPLRRVCSLARYLHEHKPDVVFVSHGRMPILALWARSLARVSSRVVIVEHSTLSRWLEVFSDEPGRHRQWQYRVELARRFYPEADSIVAVSNGVADDLAKTLFLPRASITTIYNPVVGPDLLAAAAKPLSHCWFAPGEPPVLLAVGRLVREKNFAALIGAFVEVRQRHRARLLILGEGEQREALEAQIQRLGMQDDIALPGWADNPYVYMRHSAVFVLCSLFEGMGIVLAEALACGCAVVSTDCPSGPREVLDGGRYGRLVPMNDIAALAAALVEQLETPIDKTLLEARGNDFSVDKSLARYQTLVEHLIAGQSSTLRGQSA